MRLRFGVAMPDQGGRPAVVGVEVRRIGDPKARRQWHFTVGHVERVAPKTVERARERVEEMVERLKEHRPCVFVDVGNPQGFALRRLWRKRWPKEAHFPHAYERTRADTALFSAFLEAYADGRIDFVPGLPHREELDRALVLFKGGGTSKAGYELDSEDEALVTALCLALTWPSHGGPAEIMPAPSQKEPQ